MRLKFAVLSDEEKIKKIHEDNHADRFNLPTARHRISNIIVEEGNEVIGSVIIKLRPEVTLVLDSKRSKRCKTKALELLIQASIMNLQRQDFEDALVFTDYEGFDKILEKHFGFRPIDAKALILSLE